MRLTSVFSDLESAVEELSELIEAAIDPETITTLRQKVTDKTVSSDIGFIPRTLVLITGANRSMCRSETRSC